MLEVMILDYYYNCFVVFINNNFIYTNSLVVYFSLFMVFLM